MTVATWAQVWGTGLRAFIHPDQLFHQLCYHCQQHYELLSYPVKVLCNLTFSAPFIQHILAIISLLFSLTVLKLRPSSFSSWFSSLSFFLDRLILGLLLSDPSGSFYQSNFTQTSTMYPFILFCWFPSGSLFSTKTNLNFSFSFY